LNLDFYHSWLYRHLINTEWFMWVIVYVVLGINILLPLIVWYAMRGKEILRSYFKHKKQQH
jgi:hypothetical protein